MGQQNNLLENELIVDNIAATQLKETIRWARFLAVAGFIMSGLMVLITLAGAIFFSSWNGSENADNGFMNGGSLVAVYLGIAAVCFFMSRFLLQFAKKTQVALKASDRESLTAAFQNLKIYFRFAGIITIVCLIFSILGVISVLFASSFSRY